MLVGRREALSEPFARLVGDLGAAIAAPPSTTAQRPARQRDAMTDNRNMILAIVLSIIVLFGWQFFVAGPQMERAQREAQLAAQQQAPQQASDVAIAAPNADGTTTGARPPRRRPRAPTTFATRDEAVAATPRVAIDTASLTGSINLTGGRLDDLRLKKYHETVDPTLADHHAC